MNTPYDHDDELDEFDRYWHEFVRTHKFPMTPWQKFKAWYLRRTAQNRMER